jgi:hypothetical protein
MACPDNKLFIFGKNTFALNDPRSMFRFKNYDMRKIHFPLLLTAYFTGMFSCQSQSPKSTDTSAISSYLSTIVWKEAKYNNVFFKYPSDWFYEKETVQGWTRLTATPESLKHIKTVRAFEVIEIDPGGRTFAEFKRDFVYTISNRGGSPATLIEREEITFKNHEAVYAEIIQDPKDAAMPTKSWGLHAGNKFYLVTIISRPNGDSDKLIVDKVTNEMLKSLSL